MAAQIRVIFRKFGILSDEPPPEMNFYPATAFLRHLLTARSTAGHGVHSPFVFDFLTQVVRGKGDVLIMGEVESLRREMLSDRRTVRVTDLGSGSTVNKGEERRVSRIASVAALPQRQAALLSRIAASLRGVTPRGDKGPGPGDPGIILELGSSLGISTLALALAAPERRVITVEGCPETAAIARENLKNHGASNATVLNLEFSAALEFLIKEGLKVSFAFIDGNHRGTALTEYVSEIASMGEEMIIVADDIRHTKEMFLAWRSVESSGIAAVTMETLRLGILFIKHGITPGRYRIRY